jgi:hypothetical protein
MHYENFEALAGKPTIPGIACGEGKTSNFGPSTFKITLDYSIFLIRLILMRDLKDKFI